MKLDPDLIRKILLAYEELPYGGGNINIPDYREDQLLYHQEILVEAGYIKANIRRTFGGGGIAMADRLTYQGHEFLNASRDDNRWEKAKTTLQKSGGFVMEVAKALLVSLLQEQLHMGN